MVTADSDKFTWTVPNTITTGAYAIQVQSGTQKVVSNMFVISGGKPASATATATTKTSSKSTSSSSLARTTTSARKQATDSTTHTKSPSSSITADTTSRTSSSTSLAASIASLTAPPTDSLTTDPPSSTTSSSSTAGVSSNSGGLSTGGKAGLAIGLLFLFGLIAAAVSFYLKKRRTAGEAHRLDDEKTEVLGGAGRQTSNPQATATAIPLTARPVGEFTPYRGERRQSEASASAVAPTLISASTEPKKSSALNGPILAQDPNRNNELGNQAEAINLTKASGAVVVNRGGPGGDTGAHAAANAAAKAIGPVRGASKRENGAKRMNLTQAPQGAAILGANAPANSAVYRAQTDFKPAMEDELALHVGQVVRILHEYDDGWVSIFLSRYIPLLNRVRLSAFVSTALNKALYPEHVYRLVQRSPAPNNPVLEVHYRQACVVPSKITQFYKR